MDDFLREIQDDLNKQKWVNIWERFGRFFIALVALILIVAAGWQAYQYTSHQRHMEQTDALLNAVKAPDAAAFKQAATKTDGVHRGIARLIEAQLLENKGETEEAQKIIEELAAEDSHALPYDLASALVPSDQQSVHIFTFTASERAGWQALQHKDYPKAKKAFESVVQGEDVPPSMLDRAKAGLTYINAQADSTKDAAAARE